MTEENEKQEVKTEEKPEEKPQEKKEEVSSLPKLSEMVERLEKANAKQEELQKRQEELVARNLLGGQSDAGVEPVKPKEETPQEYAKRISEGKL